MLKPFKYASKHPFHSVHDKPVARLNKIIIDLSWRLANYKPTVITRRIIPSLIDIIFYERWHTWNGRKLNIAQQHKMDYRLLRPNIFKIAKWREMSSLTNHAFMSYILLFHFENWN